MVKLDKLTGPIYTSAELDEAILRAKRAGRDYEFKFVDWDLYNAFRTLIGESNVVHRPWTKQTILNQLKAAVDDDRITKKFKNVDATIDGFKHFLGADKPSFLWNENFRAASALIEESLVSKLTPINFTSEEMLLHSFSNKKASAGLLGGTKEAKVTDIYQRLLETKQVIKDGGWPDTYSVAFHRSQMSGYIHDLEVTPEQVKQKDRGIWGLDGVTVSLESQYAIPLMEHLSRSCPWYAGGKSPVDYTHILNGWRNRTFYWYSLDFSKFDQTVPAWLIGHVFELIKKCFPASTHRELDWICDNFINTKIVMQGGDVLQKHRGIPSGSFFTQIVGSICNALVIMTYLNSVVKKIPEKRVTGALYLTAASNGTNVKMMTMGDDNIFFTVNEIDIRDLSSYVLANFGMVIHPDKTDWHSSTDNSVYPKFLKREWLPQGAYRDPLEVMVNTIHPERDRRSDTYNPYVLIHGLYLTYPVGFRDLFTLRQVTEKMLDSKYPFSLDIGVQDLPGSLKAYGSRGVDTLRSHITSSLRSLN